MDSFANIIIKSYSTVNFLPLVHQILPALFGYYSSYEQLELATQLYTKVIETAPSKLIVELLFPLLNSSVTFRFVEQAMTSYYDNFTGNFEFIKESDAKNFGTSFGFLLIQSAISSLPLLPSQVLNLLKQFFNATTKKDDFTNLFLKHFIFYQAQLWLNHLFVQVSPSLMMIVFNEAINMKTEIGKLFESLMSTESVYDLTKFYTKDGIATPAVVFSVSEIIQCATILDKLNFLPSSISLSEFTSISQGVYNNIVLCQFFLPPNFQVKDEISLDPLIFSKSMVNIPENDEFKNPDVLAMRLHALEVKFKDSEKNSIFNFIETMDRGKEELKEFAYKKYLENLSDCGQIFEKFMRIERKNQMIIDFSEIITFYEEIIYNNYIDKKYSAPDAVLTEISSKISSIGLKKHAILAASETYIKKNFESEQMILNQVDLRFNDLILNKYVVERKRPLFKGKVLKQCISQLRGLDRCTLYLSFNKLMKIISILSVFEDYNDSLELFPQLIDMTGENHFLSKVITLNVVAMKNYLILPNFSQDEISKWNFLEKLLYDIVKIDKWLSDAILQTQELLTMRMEYFVV
ncbi:hypothetical protein TVAG_237730 [Trichomonas vaginalis G3]|uniref:Uncharacterized protein n=1 Tax=Trichomonas vaginalis (strain ATCC PRA-98 / G3) TaxID=412133 RepID=A2DCX3_TRIV3|nr:hypothetical protein TVAGG3_0606470 [Trichomonas vaginalis G3]EAY21747.1 hypothetical protein TVAG_237730 [Trichomonas vaginalis G3]KAI5524278.1 hypothetical protein TVAGG3_0606470 [Trichomonas vaginalis G3]|eukprot:XP_001582733.1 hypothetical protein [Trichomonas vaginalis G3]